MSMAFTPAELAEHRADAESLMLATLRGYAPAARKQQNEETGREERGWNDMGLTRGKVPGISRVSLDPRITDLSVAGQITPQLITSLHLPLSAYLVGGRLALKPGWEFVCEAVAPGLDPAHVGRRWKVLGVPVKDYATARRLDVEEVPTP